MISSWVSMNRFETLLASLVGCAPVSLLESTTTQKLKSVLCSTCFSYPWTIVHVRVFQELAKYSPVPVLNALSSLWHPTQVLADLLTLHEKHRLFEKPLELARETPGIPPLSPLTVAYVGDSANVLHDMLVTYPRMGHKLRIASPDKYRAPSEVWDRVVQLGCDKDIVWTADPKEAVHNADVVVTDTW